MALSKALLKGMGLTEEQITAIIDGHMDSVKALQDEVKDAKQKTEDVQKELDTLREQGDGGWKEKYEKEHSDFEAYKQAQEEAKSYAAKEKAYKAQLKEAGVTESLIDLIVKADADKVKGIELDDSGNIKDAKKLLDSFKETYKNYITDKGVKGEDVNNPPAGGKGTSFENMSLAQKMAYANEHPDAPEVSSWLGK